LGEKELSYRRIPRRLVPKGIELCKKNVADYLDDARTIISKGRLCHAFLSVQLAIEELGKAIILKEEYERSGNDFILVDAAVFGKDGGRGHKLKASKAWTMLDPSRKILHKGGFEKGAFSEYGFDVDTEASHHTRLKCAYVDFIEEEQLWWIGGILDEAEVLGLIEDIEKASKKL
jgi:AbiV family abortive infection protein